MSNFIKATAQIISKHDGVDHIVKSLEHLSKQQLLVGIPEAKTVRENQGINNATLAYTLEHGVKKKSEEKGGDFQGAFAAYLHEKGDPLWRIPPRPFLEPAIEAHMPEIQKAQAFILNKALAGQTDQVDFNINRLGLSLQKWVKAWFVDSRNGWAPNAPRTIKKKGSDRPNIDTSQLRNSIQYVIDAQ